MTDGMSFLGFVLIIIIGISLVILLLFRCTKCKRIIAMKKTGAVRERPIIDSEQLIFNAKQIEQKCKYCGHIRWTFLQLRGRHIAS